MSFFFFSLNLFFVFFFKYSKYFVYVFLFVDQKLQCVTSSLFDSSDSAPTESPQDKTVYILLFFPMVVILFLCVMPVHFIYRHDMFWYVWMSLVKIIMRYCMYIEDNSDDSYLYSTDSVSSYRSMSHPTSSMTDDSTRVKDVSSSSDQDQRDSSWDSILQDEAQIIARFIRFMRDRSGSIATESEIPSSISSYLPVPSHIYDDDDFTPLSFVDDSEQYSTDSTPIHSLSVLDLSDQCSSISTVHTRSRNNLHSSRDQSSVINVDRNSSEENLHSSRDQSSASNVDHSSSEENLDSSRDQPSAINVDHNSSEENLHSSRDLSSASNVDHNSSEENLDSSRDQPSTINVGHNSSEEILHCSRDQSSSVNVDHNSSESDLHSIESDQSEETNSIVCKVDHSIQVDMDQATSEDIQSDISTPSNSTNQQIERPFFTTRSGKIYHKNI